MQTEERKRQIMRSHNIARSGFSLIELLVVIAIIAILAALIFPVYSRVKEQNRQATCMTDMQSIYEAMKLYELDNGRYPASLLGFGQIQVNDSSTNTNSPQFYVGNGQAGATGSPLPFEQLGYKPLFQGQKGLNDKNLFVCPDAPKVDPAQLTTAVYPADLGTSLANQPVVFSPLIQHNTGNDANAYFTNNILGKPAYFFKFDDYDTGPQLDSSGNAVPGVTELHYSLDWTGGSGPSDAPNQLKYPRTAPQDATVVTWCAYHAAVNHSNVLVLLLNGTTKAVDPRQFVLKGPLNFAR
jgi:prepilin-type N-terminal cleavage/methylation domain-containing protein